MRRICGLIMAHLFCTFIIITSLAFVASDKQDYFERSDEECPTVSLDSRSGRIESPVNQNGVYHNNLDCTWIINISPQHGNVS